MITTPSRDIYTISRLNSELRHVLEGSFPLLWLEGEISNLSMPRSGHLYFSLKDAHAQIRCAMFRNRRNLLRCNPANGNQVLVRAKVAMYEPRGDCQLIIEHLEMSGNGALQQAFEALKTQLQQEGLFDTAHKRPLPRFPQRIGIISSPSGAALRDVLQVLNRRYPAAQVTLYPSSVQGTGAAQELTQALRLAIARGSDDVLILTRGGGSLEDLAAFNDESLARLIAAATIPIISAVGHEIDFTIADFVADRRAPTPSAAAELASPDQSELTQQFAQWQARLEALVARTLRDHRTALSRCEGRLMRQAPAAKLQQHQQRLDELQIRMGRVTEQRINSAQRALQQTYARLQAQHPKQRLALLKQQLQQHQGRLNNAIKQQLYRSKQQLASRVRELNAVSPMATLERGYSITTDRHQRVVSSVDQASLGDLIEIRLSDGRLTAQVSDITPSSTD